MVLAFLVPQLGPGYYGKKRDCRLERFLVPVDEIEELTGLNFLRAVEDRAEAAIERDRAKELWRMPAKQDFVKACQRDD